MGPFEKLKSIWNNRLSEDGQNSVRNNALLTAGGVIAGVILSLLSLPAVVTIPVIAGFAALGSTNLIKPDSRALADIRASNHPIEWQNEAGQTLQGSTIQFVKLCEAERKINGLFAELSQPPASTVEKIKNRFDSVARAVSVIQDIPNGNGKFAYALPAP